MSGATKSQKLLWIGSYTNDEAFRSLHEYGYDRSSLHVCQKNILEGMETVCGQAFDSLGNVMFLANTNKCSKLFFPGLRFSHRGGSEDKLIPGLNILYIDRLVSRFTMAHAARKWIRTHPVKDADLEIVVYEMRSVVMRTAALIKKHVPSARITQIVPDLPQYMGLNMTTVKKMLKKWDWISIRRLMKAVDAYVLYSEQMAEFLNIADKKWILMEGALNVKDATSYTGGTGMALKQTSRKHIAMYSGLVDASFGIIKLIEAFQYLDDDYELWITGSGPANDAVKKAAEKDDRIKFFGFIPSRDDLLNLQNEAEMMMNMRDPDSPASEYCFPSKIYDYMLVGKPVLSCRLPCIPDEYFKYMIEIKSLAPVDIANAIRRTARMNLEQKNRLGACGREFIMKEKTNVAQAEKVIKWLGWQTQ